MAPDFTRKHYEKIAWTIYTLPSNPSKEQVISLFAKMLADDNYRFQPDKFAANCAEGEY